MWDAELQIDSCILSNFYSCPKKQFSFPFADEMKHAWLASVNGSCAEAFFQAAKCETEADAQFFWTLQNPKHIAFFGRGKLPLTAQQAAWFNSRCIRLIEVALDEKVLELAGKLGIDNGDMAFVEDCDKGSKVFMRATPMRKEWDAVKDRVMFHILKAKFLSDSGQPGAFRTLANLAAHGVSDVVEHTDLDSYWGDGLVGSGFNVLGKLISRLLQYARTGDPQWLDFPAEGSHQPAAESTLYP